MFFTDNGADRMGDDVPPDELNAILTLYTKVTQKTLLISRTMGIEGRKLLTPQDDYEALKPNFTEVEIVNLTMLIGMINLWNRLAISMRQVHPVKDSKAA